jgi:hypothetical protein
LVLKIYGVIRIQRILFFLFETQKKGEKNKQTKATAKRLKKKGNNLIQRKL